MMSYSRSVAALVLLTIVCNAFACQVKNVDSNSYTTTDGLVVSNVAYITTFSLTCAGSARSEHLTLFAEVGYTGRVVPVSTALDGGRYQVSWTEEVAKAPTGSLPVKIYDEEGYSLLRKNQRRVEEGQAAEEVKPITVLTVYHPGTYKGLWFNVEVMASFAIVAVYYIAYSAKSKLTA